MNKLSLEATEYTPEVVLDAETNTIYFKGECRPENVSTYFEPIINWFNEIKSLQIQKPLEVIFYLDYFNSSSAKYLMDIIFLIKEINDNGGNIDIVWKYDKDDEDVYEAGVEFEDISGVKFTYKAID